MKRINIPAISLIDTSDTPQLTFIRLGDIDIDLGQPARRIPHDLRIAVATGKLTGAQAIAELVQRAGAGDLEATGYLAQLTPFAEDIDTVGLQHPIRVATARVKGRLRYQLIVGERRYWACLYLAARQGLSETEALKTTIEAVIDDAPADERTADDIRRAQWAENLQRAEVAPMDYALAVSAIYDSAYARAQAQRREVFVELELDDDGQSDSDLGIALAQKMVLEETGKPIARRTIFNYAHIAKDIVADAQRLARAYHMGVRDLERLMRTNPESQVDMMRQLVSESSMTGFGVEASGAHSGTNKNGRPTRAERVVRFCLRVPEELSKNSDRQLATLELQRLQEILSVAEDATESLRSYCQRVRAMLNRPGLTENSH